MSEPTRVSLAALLDAYEFASFQGVGDNHAYVNRETGEIIWSSTEVDDEIPEDVDDPAHYAVVPNRHDLDLGTRLVMRYVTEVAPDLHDRVSHIFQSRGAYGQFKELLRSEGRLDSWYAFEETRTEAALREWCASEGLAPFERADG